MSQTLTSLLLAGAGGVLLWLWAAAVWGRGSLARIVGAARQAPAASAVSAAARLWLLSLLPLGACLLILGTMMVPGFPAPWIPAAAMLFVGVTVVLVVSLVWAVIPGLGLPAFLTAGPARPADQLPEVGLEPGTTQVLPAPRPVAVAVSGLALAALGAWGLWSAVHPVAKVLATLGLLLGVAALLIAAPRLLRGGRLVLDRTGLVDQTTAVTKTVRWVDVVDIRPGPLSAVLTLSSVEAARAAFPRAMRWAVQGPQIEVAAFPLRLSVPQLVQVLTLARQRSGDPGRW
ncbi:MAG: hypothetical protein Q3997_00140 [Propionibacteriaceae bacterium]|nr:hypothetical protein [Propionibacteriaceae bacterium]